MHIIHKARAQNKGWQQQVSTLIAIKTRAGAIKRPRLESVPYAYEYNYQKALRCKYFAPPFWLCLCRARDPNTNKSRRDVIHLFLFASLAR